MVRRLGGGVSDALDLAADSVPLRTGAKGKVYFGILAFLMPLPIHCEVARLDDVKSMDSIEFS